MSRPEIEGFQFEIREQSDWQCYLFGGSRSGIVWRPEKGKEPNRFWRWMQWLCFGNEWVRVAKKS